MLQKQRRVPLSRRSGGAGALWAGGEGGHPVTARVPAARLPQQRWSAGRRGGGFGRRAGAWETGV